MHAGNANSAAKSDKCTNKTHPGWTRVAIHIDTFDTYLGKCLCTQAIQLESTAGQRNQNPSICRSQAPNKFKIVLQFCNTGSGACNRGTNKSKLINMCIHHNLLTNALCDSLRDTLAIPQMRTETCRTTPKPGHTTNSHNVCKTPKARGARGTRDASTLTLDLKTPVTCWIASLS